MQNLGSASLFKVGSRETGQGYRAERPFDYQNTAYIPILLPIAKGLLQDVQRKMVCEAMLPPNRRKILGDVY